jgi:hypothetical protein
MLILVLDGSVHVEELLDHVCIMVWLNMVSICDAPKVIRHVSLMFNDHVMQDDATYDYFP